MIAIGKKSKVKNWKYDFLFVHCKAAWADVPAWNEGKPVCSRPFNWGPKLPLFENDFFLTTADLLILKDYSKGN